MRFGQAGGAELLTRIAGHGVVFVVLTALTQIGGLAWLIALFFRRRLLAFAVAYLALFGTALFIAPLFGRVGVTCWRDGPLQVHSWGYCLANRTFMAPELLNALEDAAEEVAGRYPGSVTLLLDASFPFGDGVPLLPHLSHDDARKADLAFYYSGPEGYVPGLTRSPVGYFAFEQGPTTCPEAWPTLRWDLDALQPWFRDVALERERTRYLVRRLAEDPRIGRMFLEPHLTSRLDVSSAKIRFQGCRAARHDDHLHVELR